MSHEKYFLRKTVLTKFIQTLEHFRSKSIECFFRPQKTTVKQLNEIPQSLKLELCVNGNAKKAIQ